MLEPIVRVARLLLTEDRAQATVEYALVLSITVALLLTVSGLVMGGLSAWYREISSLVCLPIP